jgi:ADP-ribose pyrophosphatase YjhB (NUDIX family)
MENVTVTVVAGVMVRRGDKFLLVQEGQPKAYGLWNWPAGRVELGSSIEETAVREAKEETGIDVRLVKKLGVWHTDLPYPVCHLYLAEMVGGELQPAPGEILDVQWLTVEEIRQRSGEMRMAWMTEALDLVS